MSSEILVIDDLRIFEFQATYCRDIADAIQTLYQHPVWSAVFWDHDLGGDQEVKTIFTDFLEPKWATGLRDPQDLGMNYIVTDNPSGQTYLQSVFERWNMPYVNASGMIKFKILGV